MKTKQLSTTSYAVLGLLALRPWTTYELAKQMERSLHYFWPTAESMVYEEPKTLVTHGLARAKEQYTGRRRSTVYSITPKGRRALERWLTQPGATPKFEFEAMLKVFFSDQGTKEDLLAQLRSIEAWAADELATRARIIADYPRTGGPFPERLHIIEIMIEFLQRNGLTILEWSRWAQNHVAAWPDTRTALADPETFLRLAKEDG